MKQDAQLKVLILLSLFSVKREVQCEWPIRTLSKLVTEEIRFKSVKVFRTAKRRRSKICKGFKLPYYYPRFLLCLLEIVWLTQLNLHICSFHIYIIVHGKKIERAQVKIMYFMLYKHTIDPANIPHEEHLQIIGYSAVYKKQSNIEVWTINIYK